MTPARHKARDRRGVSFSRPRLVSDLVAGELPKAFVVRRGDVSSDDIVKFVEERVAPHKKLMGGVEFIDQIPKSPSGKILRRILRSRNSQGGTRSKL